VFGYTTASHVRQPVTKHPLAIFQRTSLTERPLELMQKAHPDGQLRRAIGSETVGLPVEAPARLIIYVPHPESRLCRELAHGSAIVGLPLANGGIRIYYEGNVIGASNLELYRAKAAQAADRMLHNYPAGYPTRAREDVDAREVVEVGTIETLTGRLDIKARANELNWWISPADLADLGFKMEVR
jgi:hypothetical protein